jgi:hypothetical protein
LESWSSAHWLVCDNESAKARVENPAHHKRSKHMEIKWHWIRQRHVGEDPQIRTLRGHVCWYVHQTRIRSLSLIEWKYIDMHNDSVLSDYLVVVISDH